ncbi:hypothetical protein CDL12_16799 [Handroanthus impetiginosus]|uniref:Desiccation-related protein PCC13-62 n=1 Tax=Handroanthus impetiginosus TaxID=429701 RepID=A0A2G9H025_9LAMI|nr:hypothetical protein CDL12_16799 [Handroanthus impetiginosus]
MHAHKVRLHDLQTVNHISSMALSTSADSTTALITILLLLLLLHGGSSTAQSDVDLLEFPLNLEYLEAEFFSWGALGRGLDSIEPNLTMGGPSPVGVRKANLSPLVQDIIAQFAYQEFGHLRAIKRTVPGFPRPLLNLSIPTFATIMNNAFGRTLFPPFNPYANDINYLLASYVIPYVGLTGYVGTAPRLQNATSKALVAGLLGVEAGQDAVIRTLLYERAQQRVLPYHFTVAEFTVRISSLRDRLGNEGLKDEGLIVPPSQGVGGGITGNILAGNQNSLAFNRTPEEVLRIVYGTGEVNVPGGFYPRGANGRIAQSFL